MKICPDSFVIRIAVIWLVSKPFLFVLRGKGKALETRLMFLTGDSHFVFGFRIETFIQACDHSCRMAGQEI